MKNLCFFFILSLFTLSISAQKTNPNYDAELAKKVGADDYGMKSFVFVMLKTGTNTSTDKDAINKAFNGHMANINKLVEEKKLIVAGPMGKNDNNYRGIFIFDVRTIEEAKKLVELDPAIKAKFLAADFYEWYGSAALAEYLPASEKVWKKGI